MKANVRLRPRGVTEAIAHDLAVLMSTCGAHHPYPARDPVLLVRVAVPPPGEPPHGRCGDPHPARVWGTSPMRRRRAGGRMLADPSPVTPNEGFPLDDDHRFGP